MGVGGSPKEMAKAIADGYLNLTVTSLRKFATSAQLKKILTNIDIIEREYRNEIVPKDDFEATRKKHFRLSNLRKARVVVVNFAKHRRIPL